MSRELRFARLFPMTTNTAVDPPRHVPRTILNWRRQQLEAVGYSLRDARRLAERADVDLHVAADLLRAGCPTDVAVRILL
jgi:hypothetical protein